MNPKRKQRLLIVLGLVSGLGLAVGLVMFALSQNINLFFTPTQIAKGEAPSAQMIRVGGMVADGTVDRDRRALKLRLMSLILIITCALPTRRHPSRFIQRRPGRRGTGRIRSGQFVASEVLAKHDENYMPPEVTEALRQSGKLGQMMGGQK